MKIKNNIGFTPIIGLLLGIFFWSCSENKLDLETDYLKITLDGKGKLTSIYDKTNRSELQHPSDSNYLLSVQVNDEILFPQEMDIDEASQHIYLAFDQLEMKAQLQFTQNKNYISFELINLTNSTQADHLIWGPYRLNISETIGETVGVVQNGQFAMGIQALNIKTLGGYPTNPDDTEPAYDIFATNNLTDVSDSVKVLYRGQTARKTNYGSKLQAYTRNRLEDKVIPVWAHENYTVKAYEDGGVVGSKIALFGSPPSQALNTIGIIEVQEGLPHPEINGEWAKTSVESTASYLIMPFGVNSIDNAISLTKQAGLKYLYHGGPFATWGHFKLNEKEFPENWESMKALVSKAEDQGVHLGVHTLSNFITTNDPYVSPIPDERLAKVGTTKLSIDLGISDKEVFIEDPKFFNQMKNNNLHTVMVGEELIRYEAVSVSSPWKLLNCVRGAFGTEASSHAKGKEISKLMDHGYKTFLSNTELSKEIALRIADFCNQTNIRQISFDGLEGNWSNGMGQYSRQLFVNTWYEHLKPELKGQVINDASNPGHFFWHIFTRMNWGEPWYAGFRESQTQYRLMNQDYFDRNLLPNMLGWFSLSPETSIMDAEWLLARAAGFDAGFGLATSLEAVEKNGRIGEILEKIKNWEDARLSGAFDEKQKENLKNINNEFTLEQTGKGEWELKEVHSEIHQIIKKVKQPGEPLAKRLNFQNHYDSQTLGFLLSSNSEKKITEISLEINNFTTIKIPVVLSKGDKLAYEGGSHAVLYDKEWNKLKEYPIDSAKLNIPRGNHSIIIDMEAPYEAVIKAELFVRGNSISIQK
ncbi:MAG: hypothetical protein GYB55_16885 [Cytophagales bacterium]|uniref:hypothetical protein n=1 Tax=Cyclobacterium marinum TaxID=104 RepID=UPI0030DD23B1|nr:hypothetical protein [Cytophagales bacterium]|tara:strand:+ start:84769 stop:87207 length:2439 start_codon:yes stop_codon:yes gene_type:complete